MTLADDFAKILYWSCVVWPLVGGVGIVACASQAARARCHVVISIILILITLCSVWIADDFSISVAWSNDGLTRFLRFLIAIGAGTSTLLLVFWSPRSLFFQSEDRRLLYNLLLFHLLVAVAMLVVAANNFFVAMLLLLTLSALLMISCFLNYNGDSLKAGWNCFRCILLLMTISLIGAFLLAAVPVDQAPFLAQFSSILLSLGIILAAGAFPMSASYMRLTMALPVTSGGISTFILSVPFMATFIRLHQIPNYQSPTILLVCLMLVSLVFVVLKERDNHQSLLVSSALMTSFSIFAGIFSDHPEGIYSACLFLTSLVVLAPLGYMMARKEVTLPACCYGWTKLALSGFPPVGIFYACTVLLSFLIHNFPVTGWIVFGIMMLRGYFMFQKGGRSLFMSQEINREAKIVLCLLILQTIILPVLTIGSIHQIMIDFISRYEGI